MSEKVFSVYYRKKGQKKPTYVGTGFEGKFADEQRAEGREPTIDLSLSIKVGDEFVKATEIRFGKKVLPLGKKSGVYLKCGLARGLTLAEVDEDDFEEAEEDELEEFEDEEEELAEEEEEETPAPKRRTRKAKKSEPEPEEDDEEDEDDEGVDVSEL